MKKKKKDLNLTWKVHTPNLLHEIGNNNALRILSKPLIIFSRLLFEVGQRAAELNDPKLNALMCRLTIYSIADPENPDYDLKKVEEIYDLAKREGGE